MPASGPGSPCPAVARAATRLTGEVARIFGDGCAETLREALAGAPCALRVAASLALLPLIPLALLRSNGNPQVSTP
jgi:hypothetical protein